MELDKLWDWDRKKLGCRIRPETGNPSEDDLRERLAELAVVNLQELKRNEARKEEEKRSQAEHSTRLRGRQKIQGVSCALSYSRSW